MDTSKTIDCVEWCFGYGGNHLGLKRVIPNLRCIAASEIEAYAVANMVSKMESGLMEPFPIWSDCKTFPCADFHGLVDLFIASYPCQPFSSAGKRGGADDPRHLWPFVRRAVEIIRPAAVFFENVDGHVSLGLREVLTELALLGYRVENSRGEPTWGVFSAAEVGAPQNRKRIFVYGELDNHDDGHVQPEIEIRSGRHSTFNASKLADAGLGSDGSQFRQQQKECAEEFHGGVELGNSTDSQRPETAGSRDDRSGRSSIRSGSGRNGVGQADSKRAGREGSKLGGSHDQRSSASGSITECCDSRGEVVLRPMHTGETSANVMEHLPTLPSKQFQPNAQGIGGTPSPLFWPGFVSRPGQKQFDWEPARTIETQRGLGGGVNGRASNVDRLRLLGNGVYPACAAKAFVTLYNRMRNR